MFKCTVSEEVDQQLLYPRQQSNDVTFDLLEALPAGIVLHQYYSVSRKKEAVHFFIVTSTQIFRYSPFWPVD